MTFVPHYIERKRSIRAGKASLPGWLLQRLGSGGVKTCAPRGQALILIVFAIVGLVAITALAVDGGNAYADRRRAQNAADAAALAGALARINGEPWLPQAYLVAKTNGYDNNGKTNWVSISSPPTSGQHKGNIEYIDVQITSNVRTYFAQVIGMRSITNTVEAVARSKPSVLGPLFGGSAVVSLGNTSDCLFNKAFYVHAGAMLDISGSGVLVNSGNPTCALITQGQGGIHIEENQPIRVVGGAQIQRPQLVSPYPPLTGWEATDYPPPIYMPEVSCSRKATVSLTDKHQMTPGYWEGDFPPDGVDTLTSGVYCLDGDFVLTGKQSLSGIGVVIYMGTGRLRWSASSAPELSAPSAGKLRGLLLYQPMNNQNDLILTAGKSSSLQGTIFAPGALIHIRGNTPADGFMGQIVGYRIEADVNGRIVVKYLASENYQALTVPEVQLVK